MRASTSLGFAIAVLVAWVVFGLWLFGDRADDWMLRAAQNQAARCLTEGGCVHIDARGGVAGSAVLATHSVCGKPQNWHPVMSAKNRAVPFVVTCTDGATYLFHIGKFRDAGAAQWVVCAAPGCAAEVRMFARG